MNLAWKQVVLTVEAGDRVETRLRLRPRLRLRLMEEVRDASVTVPAREAKVFAGGDPCACQCNQAVFLTNNERLSIVSRLGHGDGR
jgi:hypothetical protein